MLRTLTKRSRKRGFSLLELVIVVVIIGIIAAIAIPRMSRGTAGAGDSAVAGDLAVLRNAIDLYAAEHLGTFPTLADIADQLLQYTDGVGDAQAAKDATHIYGPYLRKIPPLPVGERKGKITFTDTVPAAGTADAGWYYNATTGDILANCKDAEEDASGTQYNDY